MFTPLQHSLSEVAQKVLFTTPQRISRLFPEIKLQITDSNENSYDIQALLDSGATSTYISHTFVEDHNIPTRKLPMPLYAYNADDSLNGKSITREAQITCIINGHVATDWFYVTNIGVKDMIIGMTWLRSHNPEINWRSGEIKFTRCPTTCTNGQNSQQRFSRAVDVASTTTEPPSSEYLCEIRHKPNLKDFNSTSLAIEALKDKKVLTLEDIKAGPFADFADVFEESTYQELPPHRKWDHKIDLVDDWETRKWKPRIYPLTYQEKNELRAFIDENLKNGRIRPSESPLASPVFFINKKDGKKRLVIDYRKLNELTVKNTYPLPIIDDLLEKWSGCVNFSTLDIRSGYYNIRMREGDEWKTAFITNDGLFESTVMTFGLTNAPATFQTMMDSIFIIYIRRGDTGAFIDDIGIATKPDPTGELSNDDYHIKVCREILQVLRDNKLSLKPEKCSFLQKEIQYLGHIISDKGIAMDPVKLEGVSKWPTPTKLKELRSFLGFINYYRRFIHDFSFIAKPLHDLQKKDAPWKWEEPQETAFNKLRDALLSRPTLVHPDLEKPYILETDASKFAYGAILSQKQEDGKLQPIGFMSRKMSQAEEGYEVHDRELLAIIRALEQWEHFLKEAKHPITILTDHANLRYFNTKRLLKDRQARWMEFLTLFDYELRYRPGRQSSAPDLLSRRIDHLPEDGEDTKESVLLPDHVFQDKPRNDSHQIAAVQTNDMTHEIYLEQAKDPLILKFNMTTETQEIPVGWSKTDDLWLYRGKIYIPATLRQTIFRILHNDPSAAHPGRDATLFSIRQHYYWPNLRQDVEEWVRNCDTCQHVKIYPRKPHGKLLPIDPTPRFWGIVTSDLITGLPPCKGFDAIWTATDKRGKMIHVAPTTSTLDSEGLYHLYLQNVWRLHGTQDKIITDRGPQFASRFARDVNKNLQIETALSTAYHPQTDGQSERTNQEVEQALRAVVSFHQDDWVDWLPVIEFALNNRYKKGLKTTPFYANYGFYPQIGSLPRINTPIVSVENFVRHLQQVQKDTEVSLKQAAEDMKRFYDRHKGATPQFEVGQKVLLDNADLAINRPSRKLAERRSGPFKILQKIGTHAYRLELPPQWKNVWPTFHVSKLEAYHEDPEHPNFTNPPPDVIEGEPEWEVETILDSKFAYNQLHYLVKWKGWADSENSWQDERDLVNAPDLITEFHKSHPGAPRRLPGGTQTGKRLTKATRKKKKGKSSRVNQLYESTGLTFVPLHLQTDVSTWPDGPMSRDATF